MNEFDEICAVNRIIDLLKERGRFTTEQQLRSQAMRIARSQRCSIADALEQIEDTLLSSNPKPEDWGSD